MLVAADGAKRKRRQIDRKQKHFVGELTTVVCKKAEPPSFLLFAVISTLHSKFAFLSRCSFARGSRRPLSVIQRFCREPVVLRRHCDCDAITAAVTAKEE